jgi:hypothetical protein
VVFLSKSNIKNSFDSSVPIDFFFDCVLSNVCFNNESLYNNFKLEESDLPKVVTWLYPLLLVF